MSARLPTVAEAKAQAKRLRAQLQAEGQEIGHSKALELVARQHGYRDWNTFHAALGNAPPEDWTPGGRVIGRYLGQPFIATVVAVKMTGAGWFRLELELDEAVDVVTFDSFSNFRKRIQGTVGPSGTSRERTSDGRPHLEIEI
ncbi:glyoxalase superfamily protein [Acidimangrovimonas pyrenivorans]|uniref:Glyoxalase superfamily protein n=1 Tax=Acidimangrovimonas pyrenivorans TaxID=2030798 RepID=A0ABV7ACV5_9RHOB